MFHRARSSAIALAISLTALIAGVAVFAQQQAAEAPAAPRPFYTRPAVAALNGVVTTGHPIASSAGLQMLLKGGNAFDAAVAVGAMAALGEPEMNGIGGNGFTTIFDKKTGKVHSLSMAGAAPKALKPAEMTPETLNAGMKAGIVPGNLGGYLSILDKLGTMSLAEVFAPAIEYAEKGYPIDQMLAQSIDRGKNNLGKYPTTAKIFLPNGQPLKAGELLKNPDYAATLRKLVDAEKQALAKKATRSAGDQGGVRSVLQGRHRAGVRSLLQGERRHPDRGRPGRLRAAVDRAAAHELSRLRGVQQSVDVARRLRSADGREPRRALQSRVVRFRIAAGGARDDRGDQGVEGRHLSLRRRSEVHGDSDRGHVVEAIRRIAQRADRHVEGGRVSGSRRARGPHQHVAQPAAASAKLRRQAWRGRTFAEHYDGEQHTTSFSIVDKFGNAIGITPTLGGLFGNNVVVGSTGLLLNNGMRLGSTSPYPDNVNYVGAGKVPILNNSPVVVLKDGKLAFVFGTPGGETIGQTQFQMLVNLIDFQLPVQQAIEAPRFSLDAEPNFYKPGSEITVQIESRMPAATIEALKAMGHKLRVSPGWGSIGHMQTIKIDPVTGTITAGGDPRRTGYAMGY